MTTLLSRIGRFAARHPWRVVAGWLVAAIAAATLASTVGGTLNDDYTMPGTDSQRATDLLRDRFPAYGGASARIVVHSPGRAVDPAVLAAVAEGVRRLPHVNGVDAPAISADGRTAITSVRYDVPVTDVDSPAAYAGLREAAAPARAAGLQTEYGGEVLDHRLPAYPAAVAQSPPLGLDRRVLEVGPSDDPREERFDRS